jgi:GNAT superfamily N-acetyltransferase
VTLSAPELLNASHQLANFDCGVPDLNDWLRKRALTNNKEGASRTYVVTDGQSVVGYYALAANGIAVAEAPGRFRRNMPDPIPVALLARLAVDRSYHGQGLGRALFRDGAKRVINAADTLGIRGLIVHAISDDARAFYLALGFEPSPLEPMTLVVTLADLKAAL